MGDFKDIVNDTFTDGVIAGAEQVKTVSYDTPLAKQLRQVMIDSYEPNKLLSQNEFNGVCLMQLKNKTSDEKGTIRLKVRIPEIHSLLPIPTSEKDFLKISLYPTFFGTADDLSMSSANNTVTPGTKVSVTFDNMTNFASGKVVRIVGLSTGTVPPSKSSDLYGTGKRPKLKKPSGGPHPKCYCSAKSAMKPGCIEAEGGSPMKGKPILAAPPAWPHPDCGSKAYNSKPENKERYLKERAKGKNSDRATTLGYANNIKLSDGTTFNHFGGHGWKKTSASASGPRLQIAHGIVDNYVKLIDELVVGQKFWTKKDKDGKTPLKDSEGNTMPMIGTQGGWVVKDSSPLHQLKTYCEATKVSYHNIGRAFDLGTRSSSITSPFRGKGGKSALGQANLDHPDIPFLVTISPHVNQTKADLIKNYAPNFFSHSFSGAKLSADGSSAKKYIPGLNTWTVWFKTDDPKAPEVSLMVANPIHHTWSKYTFNKDTFTLWKGKAINFTMWAAKYGFTPIHPFPEWRTGSPNKFEESSTNVNEWHHFQAVDDLTEGSSPLGRELLATGYSETELITNWRDNWEFYKNAPYRGNSKNKKSKYFGTNNVWGLY